MTGYDNALCKAVCKLIMDDYDLYILSGEVIENHLLKKANKNKFNECRAMEYYRKMIKQHQDYIIQRFNNCPVNTEIFDKIHYTTFNINFRGQLKCLMVNAFALKNNVEF
jgi:hypothetical protein